MIAPEQENRLLGLLASIELDVRQLKELIYSIIKCDDKYEKQ